MDEGEQKFQIKQLLKDVEALKKDKVDKMEFHPYKIIMNGLVGAILFAFIGAVIALVIK